MNTCDAFLVEDGWFEAIRPSTVHPGQKAAATQESSRMLLSTTDTSSNYFCFRNKLHHFKAVYMRAGYLNFWDLDGIYNSFCFLAS